MSRTFTLVSVSVHAFVIGSVYVAQAFHVGPLPIPREALAIDARLVTIKDIDLPPPPPSRTAMAAQPGSASAAPIEAPPEITPETGREREAPAGPTNPTGVESGVPDGPGIDAIPGATAPPPPPPPPPPQTPVRLHSGIQPPRKIVDVSPPYPELARAAHQQGVVILEAVIDTGGAVETVRVLRGYPLLDQAAIDAVRHWRFTAALLNGEPVPVVMTVTVNFRLQ
jgi:protein TonB